jgi:hypothetical protein
VTEAQWLAGTDPAPMLEFLRGKASSRKLRLLCVTCCHLIWPRLLDKRSRKAVAAAEQYADGLVAEQGLKAAWDAARQAARKSRPSRRRAKYRQVSTPEWDAVSAATADDSLVEYFAPEAVQAVLEAGDPEEPPPPLCPFIRDIFGNPLRPVAADPRWLTSTAVALAQTIYGDRAFDRLPILADALEDAGCDDYDVLGHLRGEGPHVRGCWALDLVLGKG